MCAQYLIKKNIKNLQEVFQLTFDIDDSDFPRRVLPYTTAPVITPDHKVKAMNFSLIPIWSKERKVKFATHNARLDTVAIKPTWKRPFTQNHCIVPISSFVEPIYTGKHAGHMVAFDSNEPLLAVGITDTWTDRQTGEHIESFSIVTDDPSDYVAKIGHDRQPVFLNSKNAEFWLNPPTNDTEDLIQFLKENAIVPTLSIEIDRPMAKGWEKRIPKD